MELFKQLYDEIYDFFSSPRDAIRQIVNVSCLIFSALMLWKLLILCTSSASPVVVVLSGSMEPGFFRGDVLLLTNAKHIHSGDIVVFQLEDREIPIVHRAISVHVDQKKNLSFLTKGDNNNVDDRGLYKKDVDWLNRSHVFGVAVGSIPFVGIITIWLNEYTWVKYSLIGFMCLHTLISKES